MKDFWVARWLHTPPETRFAGGRRVILKKLCFGPAEAHIWFAAEDGSVWHEHQLLEGTAEQALEPVSQAELRRLLEREISLCRQLHQEHLISLFQQELNRLN